MKERRKTFFIYLWAILILLGGIFFAQSLLWGIFGGLVINFYAEKMANEKKIRSIQFTALFLGPLIFVILFYFNIIKNDFHWANVVVILAFNWAETIVEILDYNKPKASFLK